MFFTEKERQVYTGTNGVLYDPLAVDRRLTILTGNKLRDLVILRNSAHEGTGDVSAEGRAQAAVEAARAELTLADASRGAFALPAFPDVTDAVALELLYHFLDWLEGKGEAAGKPQESPASSPAVWS